MKAVNSTKLIYLYSTSNEQGALDLFIHKVFVVESIMICVSVHKQGVNWRYSLIR